MPEVETTNDGGATSLADLQRENRELRNQLREVNAEARDHRLERNEARKQAKEFELQVADLSKKGGGATSKELETLRKENLQLKHRDVFKDVARDSGARTSRAALDTLWDAMKYEADGDANPDDLKAKIEAVKATHDFLFLQEPNRAEDDSDRGLQEAKRVHDLPKPPPAARPGPGGTGRGATADGTGAVKVRKSDLQSFDPRVNPMLDRNRAAEIESAKKAGKLVYLDE